MKECGRCGNCCRWLGMKMRGMSPEIIDYLTKRGCQIDDAFILIPHRCQHLRVDESISVYVTEEDGTKWLKQPKFKCNIHDTDEYPLICKRFHGHGRYYIPTGCVFASPDGENKEDEIFAKAVERNVTRRAKKRV